MCENTSDVRLPGIWLAGSGANEQLWFQEDSCFVPSANIHLKTHHFHRNNIWESTLRCTHCHGDRGVGRHHTDSSSPPRWELVIIELKHSVDEEENNVQVSEWLKSPRPRGRDVSLPFVLTDIVSIRSRWLDRGTSMALTRVSFRWTRRWIFNEFSSALLSLCLSCYRWVSPRAPPSFNALMGRTLSSLAMRHPN